MQHLLQRTVNECQIFDLMLEVSNPDMYFLLRKIYLGESKYQRASLRRAVNNRKASWSLSQVVRSAVQPVVSMQLYTFQLQLSFITSDIVPQTFRAGKVFKF